MFAASKVCLVDKCCRGEGATDALIQARSFLTAKISARTQVCLVCLQSLADLLT